MTALLIALLLQSAYPPPPPVPVIFAPVLFKLALQEPTLAPGDRCMAGQPDEQQQSHGLHECHCRLMCSTDAETREQTRIEDNELCTSRCHKNACACHADEACAAPDVEPPK